MTATFSLQPCLRSLCFFAGVFMLFLASASQAIMGPTRPFRNLMYLTGQHPVVPDLALTASITHVSLAFMRSDLFNKEPEDGDTDWPIFMSVAEARTKFSPGTKIMVSIGGWGDTQGFEVAARTSDCQDRFAENVKNMLEATGADGVDIDWEYPGGNGEDYKIHPNLEKVWEIEAYVSLLQTVSLAISFNKLLSIAVPGKPGDMIAYTPDTVPRMPVSFFNVMTYDLMNRRDNVTKHSTGVANSLVAIDAYIRCGAPPEVINLGFAFYVKYFRIDPVYRDLCVQKPLGCPTGRMEGEDGSDLGKTGGFSWHDPVPDEVKSSFAKALRNGSYDAGGGGYYYFDERQDLFWTFDLPMPIKRKFPEIVQSRGLGGVFAWGLGEDAPRFEELKAVSQGVELMKAEMQRQYVKEDL